MSSTSSCKPHLFILVSLLFVCPLATSASQDNSTLIYTTKGTAILALVVSVPHRYVFDQPYMPLTFLQFSYLLLEAANDNNNFNYNLTSSEKQNLVVTYLDWSTLDFFSNYLHRKTQYFQIVGSRFSYFVALAFALGITLLIERFMQMMRYRERILWAWCILQALLDWVFAVLWYFSIEYLFWLWFIQTPDFSFDEMVALFVLLIFVVYVLHHFKKVFDVYRDQRAEILQKYLDNSHGAEEVVIAPAAPKNRYPRGFSKATSIRMLGHIGAIKMAEISPVAVQSANANLDDESDFDLIIASLPSSELLTCEETLKHYNKNRRELVYLCKNLVVASLAALYNWFHNPYFCYVPCYATLLILQIYSLIYLEQLAKVRKFSNSMLVLGVITLSILFTFFGVSISDYLIFGVMFLFLVAFCVDTVLMIWHIKKTRFNNNVSNEATVEDENKNVVKPTQTNNIDPVLLQLTGQIFNLEYDKTVIKKKFRKRRQGRNNEVKGNTQRTGGNGQPAAVQQEVISGGSIKL